MNDRELLEQDIESAQEVVNRLKEMREERYGYSNDDIHHIMSVLKKGNKDGFTVSDIRRKSRRCAVISTEKLDLVLDEIISAGKVEKVIFKSFGGRGRPRVAYIAKEFV